MSARHSAQKAQSLLGAPAVDARDRAMAAADVQLAQAKHRVSLACLACLRNACDAPAMVRQALDAIEGARQLLAQATEER